METCSIFHVDGQLKHACFLCSIASQAFRTFVPVVAYYYVLMPDSFTLQSVVMVIFPTCRYNNRLHRFRDERKGVFSYFYKNFSRLEFYSILPSTIVESFLVKTCNSLSSYSTCIRPEQNISIFSFSPNKGLSDCYESNSSCQNRAP